MSHHTALPIYKVAYDLFNASLDLAKNMPRDVKRLVGERLSNECMEITILVFRANVARIKAPHLDDLIERLQVAELLLRLARDKRLISTKQYGSAVELTTSVGKQAAGWRRSSASPAS